MRYFCTSLGVVSLGLGIAGIVLPLLPTTPFVLLAAFCFGRSSPRFHAWLSGHPVFGPIIDNWRERRAIDRRSKLIALCMMAAAIGLSAVAGVSPTILTIQIAVSLAVATFIMTRRSA